MNIANMTQEQLIALVTQQQAKLQAVEDAKAGRLSFKVGLKGGVSIYGMGRFPITLYPEQWDTLITATPKLKAFIDENRKHCQTNSEKYELISDEGKAKGLKDAKLDEYIKTILQPSA